MDVCNDLPGAMTSFHEDEDLAIDVGNDFWETDTIHDGKVLDLLTSIGLALEEEHDFQRSRGRGQRASSPGLGRIDDARRIEALRAEIRKLESRQYRAPSPFSSLKALLKKLGPKRKNQKRDSSEATEVSINAEPVVDNREAILPPRPDAEDTEPAVVIEEDAEGQLHFKTMPRTKGISLCSDFGHSLTLILASQVYSEPSRLSQSKAYNVYSDTIKSLKCCQTNVEALAIQCASESEVTDSKSATAMSATLYLKLLTLQEEVLRSVQRAKEVFDVLDQAAERKGERDLKRQELHSKRAEAAAGVITAIGTFMPNIQIGG